MKLSLIILFILPPLSFFTQEKNYDWYSFGVQHISKDITGVSGVYSDDHYSLINYPTCRGEFYTSERFYRFDLSGLFYYLVGLKDADSPNDSKNFQTTTDRSMEKIQDYLSWEWMSTKMRNPDNSLRNGFGWQFGMRRFGFAEKGLLKTGISINPGYPDAGPYSYRGTFSGGMNYQLIKDFGAHATARLGLVANALAGIGKYGCMFYPEVSLNLHIWRVAIIGTAAYETTYLYATTQKPFEVDPAENSGIIRGLRFEMGFGFDLNK